MNYSLHPEASEDLRDAASFYREQAGTSLSQSFFGEFEQSINRLLQHPALGAPWRGRGRRRYVMKHFRTRWSIQYQEMKFASWLLLITAAVRGIGLAEGKNCVGSYKLIKNTKPVSCNPPSTLKPLAMNCFDVSAAT